uniref:Uncharacterized protein n=1 Tax=Anguilla anguilla TaxID=7936 RepID=A0A0E9UPB4_ANGAN
MCTKCLGECRLKSKISPIIGLKRLGLQGLVRYVFQQFCKGTAFPLELSYLAHFVLSCLALFLL